MSEKLSMRALFNSIYFFAGVASIAWLASVYSGGGDNMSLLMLTPLLLVGGLCAIVAIASAVELFGFSGGGRAGNKLPNQWQYLLRVGALTLPLPFLLYCSYFQFCVAIYDRSDLAERYVFNLSQFEKQIFRKSIVYSYISKESFRNYSDLSFATAYMRGVTAEIENNWSRATGVNHCPDCSMKTILDFSVYRDGSVGKVEIKQSSGVPSIDRAAIEALHKSAPFARIPAFGPDSMPINFSFTPYFRKPWPVWTREDLQPLAQDISEKISDVWTAPCRSCYTECSVEFFIDASGQVSNLHTVYGSGDIAFDQSAMQAIKKASPFSLSAADKTEKPRRVCLSFVYSGSNSPNMAAGGQFKDNAIGAIIYFIDPRLND